MSPVFFVSASSAFMAAFLGLSVVAVPTVRDTNNEIEFDFVGRGPGPQEQKERNMQEGAQRYHHENEDEYSAPLSTMRAAGCRAEPAARNMRVVAFGGHDCQEARSRAVRLCCTL